jgi:hypothetical protein
MQMDLEWTRVTPHKGLPPAKPDYFESFTVDQYPQEAPDTLDWIRPSKSVFAMPTFSVELKP